MVQNHGLETYAGGVECAMTSDWKHVTCTSPTPWKKKKEKTHVFLIQHPIYVIDIKFREIKYSRNPKYIKIIKSDV